MGLVWVGLVWVGESSNRRTRAIFVAICGRTAFGAQEGCFGQNIPLEAWWGVRGKGPHGTLKFRGAGDVATWNRWGRQYYEKM